MLFWALISITLGFGAALVGFNGMGSACETLARAVFALTTLTLIITFFAAWRGRDLRDYSESSNSKVLR